MAGHQWREHRVLPRLPCLPLLRQRQEIGGGGGQRFLQRSLFNSNFCLLLAQARTMYDYQAQDEGQLSFKADELLTIITGDDGSGWSVARERASC